MEVNPDAPSLAGAEAPAGELTGGNGVLRHVATDAPVGVLVPEAGPVHGLVELAAELGAAREELAGRIVEEGLRDDRVPSLARLERRSQAGLLPSLIATLSGALCNGDTPAVGRSTPLAALVRDHARERESLGFGPREIVTEFQLLRGVLEHFVAARLALATPGEALAVERRLNRAIDGLVIECVAAYFDRVTADLAYRARCDALTELLNHQAFSRDLDLELDRAKRYQHGLSLVFFDLDHFKELNDTFGHREGDRVLRRLATVVRDNVRGSDLAGRMGGDEFAVCLLEAEADAGNRFLARLQQQLDKLIASGELPGDFALSAGLAHFPSEGLDADRLFRLADARLYAAKRAKQA